MDVSPCIIKIEYTKPSKCGDGETCGHSEGRVDRGWCIGLCVALVLAQHYRRVLTLKYLIHGLTDPMMTSFCENHKYVTSGPTQLPACPSTSWGKLHNFL